MPQKEGMNVLYHQASNTLFFTIVYGPGIFNLIFVKHGFSYYQWNQVKHQFSETIILRKNFRKYYFSVEISEKSEMGFMTTK
jgi:hypothetical protein